MNADLRFIENEAAKHQANGLHELAAPVWVKAAMVARQHADRTEGAERKDALAMSAEFWLRASECCRQASKETDRSNLN